MDDSRYRAIFLQETQERLSAIEKGLLQLEGDPRNSFAVDRLFRHYHSIKGMCSSMGYATMKEFAHAQEDLLDRLRKTGEAATQEMVSTLLSSLDIMKEMTRRVQENLPLEGIDPGPTTEKIKELSSPRGIPASGSPGITSEEPPHIRLPGVMKVQGRVFDELLSITGDLLTTLSSLGTIAENERSVELKERVHALAGSVDELRSNILSARMLPFSTLAETLPRLVRDISARDSKQVELTMEGGEISLDRGVLESMADPLVHIIKNAIDHGIETPEERRLCGKPEKGSITVTCAGEKERAVVRVTDDGRGIDSKRLKEKALTMGIEKERLEGMAEKEALLLVCIPGLSLSRTVTDVSGRGVGMDIVKNAVMKTGGALTIESSPGTGTSVIMELPRSPSIIKVLLVAAGKEVMAIPALRVEKVVLAGEGIPGRLEYGGEDIPAKRLTDIMGMDSRGAIARLKVVITGDGGHGFLGLAVDGVLGEISAYTRPLAPPFSRLKGVMGFTTVWEGGDGRPVFILDIPGIISETVKAGEGS